MIKSSDPAFSRVQPSVNLVPSRSNIAKHFRFHLRYTPAACSPVQDSFHTAEQRPSSAAEERDGVAAATLTATADFTLRPDQYLGGDHGGGTQQHATSLLKRLSPRSIAENLFAGKRNSFS